MKLIRHARPDDTPVILEFIQALAAYERLSGSCLADQDGLRQGLFGPRPYAEVLIAEEEGTPCGFALFFHNFSTFLAKPGLFLEDLFVSPHYRGRGHGRALLAHLAGLALERGCGRLEWSVLDWNEPAIAFYLSLGARPMEEWTTYRVEADGLQRLAGG